MSDQPNDSAFSRGLLPSPARAPRPRAGCLRPLGRGPGEAEGALSRGDGVRVDAAGDADAEDGGRLAQVVVHLGEQPVEGVEGEHGTDARHEGHRDAFAVQVEVGAAQDVGFNGALFAVELGVSAHGDGGGEELGGLGTRYRAHDPAGVDAIGGDDAFDVLGQVCGREA